MLGDIVLPVLILQLPSLWVAFVYLHCKMKVTNDFTFHCVQCNNNTACVLDVCNAVLITVTRHIIFEMTPLTLVLEIGMGLHFHVVCHPFSFR